MRPQAEIRNRGLGDGRQDTLRKKGKQSGVSLQVFCHILGHLFTLLINFILKKVFGLQPWISS
jgi:hypothetical protein